MSICHPGTGSEDSGSIKKNKTKLGSEHCSCLQEGEEQTPTPRLLLSYVVM